MLAKPIYQHLALAAVWSFLVDLSCGTNFYKTKSFLTFHFEGSFNNRCVFQITAIFNVFIDVTGK